MDLYGATEIDSLGTGFPFHFPIVMIGNLGK
jgi:hypothetical protein